MNQRSIHPAFALLAWAALSLASWANAQAPELQVQGISEVTASGDAIHRFTLTFPAAAYAEAKSRMPNAGIFLRNVASSRADEEIAPGAVARYDDASSSVVMEATELGAVKNLGGGLWEAEMDEPSMEFVGTGTDGGRAAIFFYITERDGELLTRGKLTIRLPARASRLEWDEARRAWSYRLAAAPGTGASRLTLDLKAKAQLMTGVYKVYGLGQSGDLDESLAAQWVAKAVFKNSGTNLAKNLRVRYRLTPYSEWSVWDKFPEVLPGQTVVSTYYPVLDPSIATLSSNTPADVLIEWRYEEADGRAREDSDGKRITLLGAHEFVFTNLVTGERSGTFEDEVSNFPLLSAFISRDDPVVKEFAALANKRAGGAAAGQDDEQAMRVLQALYELLLVNDITYQHPPALVDTSARVDYKLVQSLKYPRDVLRDRSGTCIDLAMLYASAVHAIGLKPALALVPGHAFPIVRLPSGRPVAIETTMVGGGAREGALAPQPFENALATGDQIAQQAAAQGQLVEVDFQSFWTQGVANPELERLPPNILQQWGLQEGGALRTAPRPTAAPGAPRKAAASAPAAAGYQGFAGTWQAVVNEPQADGTSLPLEIKLAIEDLGRGRYAASLIVLTQVQSPQGLLRARFDGSYSGELEDADDDELVLRSESRATAIEGGAIQPMSAGKLKLELKGSRIEVKEGSFGEGWHEFSLERQ